MEQNMILLCYVNSLMYVLKFILHHWSNLKMESQKPLLFGDLNTPKILLWHYREHYEQIVKIGVNI